MKKTVLVLFSVICVLFGFSSCSLRMESVDNLICAPKLTGNNLLVQQALDQSVNDNLVLKIPMSGEHSAAFVYHDIDNDGDNECVAFYALKSEDTVHMNILDLIDREWISVCDIKGSGSDVYSLVFADVDGDERDDMIVTWSVLESKTSKYLSVFGRYTPETGVEALMSEMFSSFHALDINGDGSDEIFLTLLTTAGDSYVASGKLFAYNKKTKAIESVSEIGLDPSVTSYLNICHDFEADVCRIYIDGVVSETHMITEVLEIHLPDISLSAATVEHAPISAYCLRSGKHICTDINDDGYIELPSHAVLPGGMVIDRKDNVAQSLYLTAWKRFSDGALTTVYQYIENTEDGYSFAIPTEWEHNITAVHDLTIDRLKFYEINENGEIGHMLFYIEVQNAVDHVYDEKTLFTDGKNNYNCTITELGREEGIRITDLMNYFVKN